MKSESELLTELSEDELEALAEVMLAPAAQARLSDLLSRNVENRLADDEQAELERILRKVDLLNILKARARLTLQTAVE